MSDSPRAEEIDSLLDEKSSGGLEFAGGMFKRFKAGAGHTQFIILSVILNFMLVFTIVFLTRSAEKQDIIHCGTSITEALQRGCTYDQLTLRWLPENCSRVGLKEYLEASAPAGWKYWLDNEGTKPVEDISLYVNGTALYTTEREHLTHCAYQLIRAAAGLQNKGALDTRARDFGHNHHCSMRLLGAAMQSPGLDEITTFVHNKLGACIVQR